jgi:hypothetical protein
MSVLFDIVAGWTGILGPFTLKIDGVALSLTGMTVTIGLRNIAGAVTPGGTVTIDPDQINNRGKVSYAPAAADFVWVSTGPSSRQTYEIHWKVVDGAGKVVYFPNGEPDQIGVYKA